MSPGPAPGTHARQPAGIRADARPLATRHRAERSIAGRAAQRQGLEPVAATGVDGVEVDDIEPGGGGKSEQLLIGTPGEEPRRHVLVTVDGAFTALLGT